MCVCIIRVVQKSPADVSDVAWPAEVKDCEFLIFKDGSVQLSSVGEPDSHVTSVWLSPTRHTFTVRFLAKIARSHNILCSQKGWIIILDTVHDTSFGQMINLSDIIKLMVTGHWSEGSLVRISEWPYCMYI